MSDVARLRQVLPARSQLPVSWYFDAEHFALEKRLLFDAGANYVGHSLMVPNFSGYVLDSVRVDDYDVNWKTFVEVYLEVYHVDPFHPGLGNFTDCNNFSVDYGEHHSVQIVAPKAGLERPGTPTYKRWHDMCLKFLDGRAPKYGALWMSYFPGVMLEWYPNVLVVSHLIPRSARRTSNVVEFYYPEEIALFERELGEQQYREAHIPGALFAHLDRDLSAPKTGANGRHPLPERGAFIAWLGQQGLKPGDQVVCYDGGSGAMAARLWWMLRWAGHEAA